MTGKTPKRGEGNILLIACGALAREITAVMELNAFRAFAVTCLPAHLHNTPELIPGAVRDKIREMRPRYRDMLVLYGDCGTGGLLDRVLEEEGVGRIGGPHCYSFFSGNDVFAARGGDMTSFFLTDYLARHFDRLIWKGLGLDRHPDIRDMVFGNYEKVVHLAQVEDPELLAMAQAAAGRLGLAFEYRFTGYGDLASFMLDRAVTGPLA